MEDHLNPPRSDLSNQLKFHFECSNSYRVKSNVILIAIYGVWQLITAKTVR